MCVSVDLMIFSLVFFRFSFHIRCKANLNQYNYTIRPYDEMKNESCELKIPNLQVHKYLGKLSRLGVIKWSLQPRRNKKKTQPVNNINCHNFVAIYLLSEAEAKRCMFTVQSPFKIQPKLEYGWKIANTQKNDEKKSRNLLSCSQNAALWQSTVCTIYARVLCCYKCISLSLCYLYIKSLRML